MEPTRSFIEDFELMERRSFRSGLFFGVWAMTIGFVLIVVAIEKFYA